MFSKNTVLAMAFLPVCLFFSQAASAEPTFAKKYAPYIGYQHGFDAYRFNDKIVSKYAPRFFVGISPVQAKNYKMGVELGYTLPVSHEESFIYSSGYGYGNNLTRENLSLKTNSGDLFFTFRQSIGNNSYWFLKPGLEYYQYTFQNTTSRGYASEETSTSIYLGTRAGIGYAFNNGIGINMASGSRFVDLAGNNKSPKKFIFDLNIEYAF